MANELTDKQRLFVEHYLACLNATEAAKRAGYSLASARQIGSENLSKPYIKAEIDARIEEAAMSSKEVVANVTSLARLDLSPFIKFNGRSKTPALDTKALIEAGYGHAIKGIVKTKFGTNVELHDRFAALQLMGKHHKLFVDRTETAHSGAVEFVVKYENAPNG